MQFSDSSNFSWSAPNVHSDPKFLQNSRFPVPNIVLFGRKFSQKESKKQGVAFDTPLQQQYNCFECLSTFEVLWHFIYDCIDYLNLFITRYKTSECRSQWSDSMTKIISFTEALFSRLNGACNQQRQIHTHCCCQLRIRHFRGEYFQAITCAVTDNKPTAKKSQTNNN